MTQIDQQNVPRLRFPGFTETLASVKLGEVASFSKGKGISKNDIAPDGTLPCIRYGELYTAYDTIIEEPISRTDVPASSLTLSKGEEVLVPASGEDAKDIATAVVVKRAGIALGGDLNIIRSENDGAFLASYLSGRKRMTLAAMAQGNSVVHLYPAQLKTLDINLPTLREQRKIAGFLGAVDTKIAQLAEKKRLLEDYKKGCMQQLFSQKIRFKDDTGNDFPDWEEKRLGDDLMRHNERVPVGTDVPVFSSSREGLLPQKDYFADRERENEGEYGVVPYGYMTYRHMSDDLTFKFNINHYATKIAVSKEYPVFTSSSIDLRFLKEWLNNGPWFRRFAAMQKLGGTRTRLYFKSLADWKVSLPHPDEQRKIADFLSALDRKIDLMGQELAHARSFKQGLLQQMFV